MRSYRSKLDSDLPRWREAGWLTAEGEASIREDVARHGRSLELAPALAIIGAVLIGFAAMSFIAANWDEMSRLARLALIFASLGTAYGIAGILFERGYPAFAHAAILAGVALFGAGIMLIAQMFHIDGHPPDAVLTWALGALGAGVVLGSNPALALAMLLMGLWSGWEMVESGVVHWPFLLGWGAVTAAFLWRWWVPGLHFAAVVLSIWIICLGYLLFDGHGHGVVVGVGLLIGAAGLALPLLSERWSAFSSPAVAYGMTIAFAGLFALQFVEKDVPLFGLVLLAIAALTLVLAGIGFGLKTSSSAALWLGYGGFSLEVLALYFKTVGTLLGSSLFFFAAGFIVIALAAVAYRLHARMEAQS
ncbi:MAG: DUF2157 domain-containing protein [Alphaproteobacteria bacterium]